MSAADTQRIRGEGGDAPCWADSVCDACGALLHPDAAHRCATVNGALKTAFTDLVGCSVPIQQAGMGGVATPELAIAVADAGALGMLHTAMAPADHLAAFLDRVTTQTTGVVGVNFLIPFLDHAAVEVAASHARVVEFFYGAPDASLVRRVHDGAALAAWQVGSLSEARAAVEAGCDFIVAQGVEAGGHVRGKLSLLPLLDVVLESIDLPVVAAGGIGTARAMAAALAAGASGVRIGTRFVATHEANAHPSYVDALIGASAEDTVLTNAFSVMWPDAPHRVLRSCVAAAERSNNDIVGEASVGGERVDVPKFSVLPPARDTTGNIDAMALYAGESVGAVTAICSAGEIVHELAAGAERLLRAAPCSPPQTSSRARD